MFKKILIPLDQSPLAEQAIGRAVAIASASGAAIDIVLVHQPIPFAGYEDAPWGQDEQNGELNYLESIAHRIAAEPSVFVTHAVLFGEASEMICRRAVDVDADLIVMTSHGRTGLSRMWLGSVADRVVRNASIPVLMLRPVEDKTDRMAADQLFEHILVPVDDISRSDDVLTAASALAKSTGGKITLLRVVHPVPLITPGIAMQETFSAMVADPVASQRLAEEVRRDLTQVARLLSKQEDVGIDVDVVIDNRVAQSILDVARARKVDAIAMSTHRRGASRLVFGSVADKVLRGSDIPILMQHPAAVEDNANLDETEVMAAKTT